MRVRAHRFEEHALGRPFHAASVELRGSGQAHGHHDYLEVMVVRDGSGEQEVRTADGRRELLPLRPGDVTLLRPGDQHTLTGHATDGVRFFNIAFPASSWSVFADLAGVDSWTAAPGPPRCSLAAADREAALAACRAALNRFHAAPAMLDLVAFWAAMIPLLTPRTAPSDPQHGVPDWLVAAGAAMNREENLRGGVPRLLALSHVSPAHLARSVRRHYGTTPTQFVAGLRLRHAAHLLATTGRPVTEIAHRCGFTSPSYFTRCFREEHGDSPRAFRHRAQRAFVP